MGCSGMRTGDIGIEPFHTVNESVVQQKPQGTIGYRWFGTETFALEPLQYIVCANGAVALQQDAQRTTPYHGKPQFVEVTVGIRLRKCPCDTPLVIVSPKPDDGLRDILLHA